MKRAFSLLVDSIRSYYNNCTWVIGGIFTSKYPIRIIECSDIRIMMFE